MKTMKDQNYRSVKIRKFVLGLIVMENKKLILFFRDRMDLIYAFSVPEISWAAFNVSQFRDMVGEACKNV